MGKGETDSWAKFLLRSKEILDLDTDSETTPPNFQSWPNPIIRESHYNEKFICQKELLIP